jgi:hypothetical protein
VRIPLKHTPVHIRAGIAFIRVAHKVFPRSVFLIRQQLPFRTGGEPGATAPSEPGILHLLYHPCRFTFFQGLHYGAVAAILYIVVNPYRVNSLILRKNRSHLLFKKRDIILFFIPFPTFCINKEQLFQYVVGDH